MFEKEAEEYQTEKRKEFNEYEQLCWGDVYKDWKNGAEFGYDECKDKLETAIEIIEQMKDLFFDCWQERGYEAIKFEQKVNDFLKENK